MFGGEIEVDESYFGGRHKGKRGPGATGKVPVFGLLNRGGKVYAKIIPDVPSTTLVPINMDLSRFRATPDADLSYHSFENHALPDSGL